MKQESVFMPDEQLSSSFKTAASNKGATQGDGSDFPLFVAIDCEMDQSDCTSVVCKVSVVDENGGLILDTLVNPEAVITRSMVRLHGVRMSWLSDAPTVTQVRQHLQEVCGKSVFIGHSVKHDLNALSLVNVHCIDTYFYEDMTQDDSMLWASRNPKKLKDLASLFLNAQIQESVHSSIIDARAAMALFKDRQEYLETRKLFHDAEFNSELSTWGRRRRRNKLNRGTA